MRIEQILYVAEQAVRQWEISQPARNAAEAAWFILFTLRARTELLPDAIREEFLGIWVAYGDLSPTRVTKPMISDLLDGLHEKDFLRIEQMTRAFLESTRQVANGLPI